ncbi:hypothetical protein Syncc8109_2234 [Synechococcus sp. WH 8109]|nr:hypothetical protein Syncc8109_2234 [Synechococcus sp. WH 8109]
MNCAAVELSCPSAATVLPRSVKSQDFNLIEAGRLAQG